MNQTVFDLIVQSIRTTIQEEWVDSFEFEPSTRFNDDLEMESIEFLKVAASLQKHYGTRIDIQSWLSGKSIHELISLSVGDLQSYVESALQKAQ